MDIDFQRVRKFNMNSIKTRLLGSHFIAIFLAVVIIEIICFISIKSFYYRNIEESLSRQLESSAKFYNKYFYNEDITIYVDEMVENINTNSNSEVQVIDKNKNLLRDSLGLKESTKIEYEDVDYVLQNGKPYRWIGVPKYTKEKCMAVSYPLWGDKKDKPNVIRVVVSLEQTDSFLERLFIIFTIVGALVIAFISIVSITIAKNIIKPIHLITETAKQMAEGNFKVKVYKKYDDEIGTLSDTLNYMAEEILKSDKLKNDFMSSISHELRTPLTSIKGWAFTLKRKEFKDEKLREEALDIIVDESERLTKLVEELLDFSRFQSGRISLNYESANISDLLSKTINELSPRLERNRIDIMKEITDNQLIKIDRNRLKQVFINIFDNAIKFTEEGGVINARLFKDNNYIVISIEDSGCGIPNKELKNIFQKFYKVDINKPGSGIGLAVCDEIIKLHNGKIHIESEEGKGTKISIFLPA
jgi:signal transduction histidine kinase